jgi:hypothetical protein
MALLQARSKLGEVNADRVEHGKEEREEGIRKLGEV